MRTQNLAHLNKIIHERARLLILTHLAGNDKESVSFNELKEKLELTPGNLSIQLKRLNEAKYLAINKTFKDNKPYTTVSVTATGMKALNDYVEEMEGIINSLKK